MEKKLNCQVGCKDMNNYSEFVVLFDSISDLDDLDETVSKNMSKIHIKY